MSRLRADNVGGFLFTFVTVMRLDAFEAIVLGLYSYNSMKGSQAVTVNDAITVGTIDATVDCALLKLVVLQSVIGSSVLNLLGVTPAERFGVFREAGRSVFGGMAKYNVSCESLSSRRSCFAT